MAAQAATDVKLTLGLICRTLGVEDVEAILALRALHLDGLRIADVGNLEAFAGTLRELHLRRNRIASLPADALAPLAPSLVVLTLSRNGLRTVAGVDFAAFAELRVLDLSHNALGAIPAAAALPTRTLTVFDARGNPCGGDALAASRAGLAGVARSVGINHWSTAGLGYLQTPLPRPNQTRFP